MMRVLVIVAVTSVGSFLMTPPSVYAQCCAEACLDTDGDGFADDLVRCRTLVDETVPSLPESLPQGEVPLAACEEIEGVGCFGGGLGGPDSPAPHGCVCVLESCEAGSQAFEDSAAACTTAAAEGCLQGGNAVVETDSAECCPDADADGFQDATCGGTDCDDSAASIHPGASETCNGLDDDCDGLVDEEVPAEACGPATDVGICRQGVVVCADGQLVCQGATFPEPETCGDGLDNDCNGATDEGCGCGGGCDLDCDGFASAQCGGIDCDDTRASVHPGAFERCANGIDDDCDGFVDEPGCA